MLSTPPATMISACPQRIFMAPKQMESSPEQQRRSRVMPGTSTGHPAVRSAMRAMFTYSPLWYDCPRITSSTRAGSTPARRTTSSRTNAPSRYAGISRMDPRYPPMGVLTAATIATRSVNMHSPVGIGSRRPTDLSDAGTCPPIIGLSRTTTRDRPVEYRRLPSNRPRDRFGSSGRSPARKPFGNASTPAPHSVPRAGSSSLPPSCRGPCKSPA